MDYAFSWIEENGGIDTEKDYPYEALQGTCDVDKRDRLVVTIDGHEDVPVNDEVSLMKVRAARLPHLPESFNRERYQLTFSCQLSGGLCPAGSDFCVQTQAGLHRIACIALLPEAATFANL